MADSFIILVAHAKLIDVAIPADASNVAKEVKNRCKYKDLDIEIARIWKTKTKVVPVVVDALGTLKIGFGKHLEALQCSVSVEQVQKIALLGTTYIMRKVLSIDQ